MTQTITLPGSNRPSRAELALPGGEAAAPAIVIVHEYWGLNDEMRGQADRFAAEGFVALAVDLYGGLVSTDAREAGKLASDMKTEDSLRVIDDAVSFLRAYPRVNGKLAITGFCLGGGQAIAAVCNVPGFDAAVPFYGLPPERFLDFTKSKAPILGHYAAEDTFVPRARVEAVAEKARAAGASFEVHFYDAHHAFMRLGDPSTYDAKSAELAWSRTMTFLRAALG